MTFRKSDPELISLYLGAEGKMRQYIVSRRKEFAESLQVSQFDRIDTSILILVAIKYVFVSV